MVIKCDSGKLSSSNLLFDAMPYICKAESPFTHGAQRASTT